VARKNHQDSRRRLDFDSSFGKLHLNISSNQEYNNEQEHGIEQEDDQAILEESMTPDGKQFFTLLTISRGLGQDMDFKKGEI
jgi:hypothetical protein